MKKKVIFIILFLLLSNKAISKTSIELQKALISSNTIKENMKCDRLINLIGGINKVELLWLGDLSGKEFQYAILNTNKNDANKIFYLCANSKNMNTNSDETLTVLGQRFLSKIFYDPIDLFTKIFSITSKDSRAYIMSTLNLKDFNISRNEINQAYIAGLMTINKKKESKYITKKKKKSNKKQIKKNSEQQNIINKIERLTSGDYYVFAHSTSGEKFWGSTQAVSKKTQVGTAYTSSGYNCVLTSIQKTKNAPFKGTFILKCPKETINGSWTQESAYSPGLGQAFTDSGDILTAYFTYNKSNVVNFVNKYYDNKQIQIAENKQEEIIKDEFIPKNTSKDKTPPKIFIADNITVNNASYILEGKVEDKGSKNIYVEIDGVIQKTKKNKFIFERFSPIDEKVKIVAIDQWGNRSKPKVINVKIAIKDTNIVKSLERLDPSKIKTSVSNNKVALIFGIERYINAPKANYANLDAKYFNEYAKNVFGIKNENIKLLIDDEANLIDSLSVLSKWLPGKIRRNQTELIIFFAGHGLASNDGKELYLLPNDGDTDLLVRTGLSRTEIFDTITKLKPKSVTMFIDACYSGVSRDEQMLLASARPIRIIADEQEGIPDNFTIFSASKLKQISSGLKEAKHGIFSYYLMKGLEGKADSNKDKKITNGELLAYMDENVSQKASELGRQQNPSLAGDPNKVLISYR